MSTFVTPWTESELLEEFWRAQGDLAIDRLQLLRLYAMVVVSRPAEWDARAVRAEFHRLYPRPSHQGTLGCFSCFARGRRLHRHHVVQIQHGGSNDRRNLVSVCDTATGRGASCHQTLHLWMRPAVDSHETTHVRLDGYVEALGQAMARSYRWSR